MKPYLVFAGDVYYPLGGFDDFKGSFDTLEEAQAAIPEDDFTWGHIVHEGAIVLKYREGKKQVLNENGWWTDED
jgi:hypothetical protein